MQETSRHVFDQPIKIGSTIDTQPLFFIQIIDLNGTITKLPFKSYEITIRQLMDNYYDISTCVHLIKGQLGFIILQGPLESKYSPQDFKLSSLNLNYDQPCFLLSCFQSQIDLNSSYMATTSKIQMIQQQKQFPLEVYFNMQKFEVNVNLNDTISELKHRLIIQRHELKDMSKDMIKIIFGSNILNDQSTISEYKGLQRGSIISIVVRINEGCFRGDSKITLADKSIKRMDEIQIGQKILSYNQTNDTFQQDQVTYIHRSYLQEEIILQLNNKDEVHTTSNHLFMCNDKYYRKIQPDKAHQSLKVGTFLKSLSDKPSQIISIRSHTLNPPQQFFHFFVKINHNFIVNNLIAHNMYYEIFYQGLTEILNLPQSQQVSNIKKDIQNRYQYHTAHNIKILNNGIEIKNNSTLNDFGIKKQSRLTILKRQPQFYNLLHPNTKLKTNKGIICAGQLEVGDKLIEYHPNKFQYMLEITKLVKNNPEEKYCLTLEGNMEITVGSLTYFQGQNGQAIIVEQIVRRIKKSSVFLRTADGERIAVLKTKKVAGSQFIHIITQPQGSFILESNLIIHGTVITIVNAEQQQIKKCTLGLNPQIKIQSIQNIAIPKLSLKKKEYRITSKGKPVNIASTLSQQKIGTGDILVIIHPQLIPIKEQKIMQEPPFTSENIIDLIMPNGQRYPIDYNKYKNKTAKEVMSSIEPNYKSSFYFLVASQIILPIDTLSKIEMFFDFASNQKATIMVVKNAKLSFLINMNLKDYQIRNVSNIHNQEQASKISLINVNQQVFQYSFTEQFTKMAQAIQNNKKLPMFQKRSIFYTPLIYFFYKPYRIKIANFMQNFQRHLKDETEQQTFKMIKSLFITIAYLPNLIPRTLIETHFSIMKIRLSQLYKKGDTLYFYQYLLTTNDEQSVQKYCGKIPSTIFHVTSTTCKNIIDFSPSAGRYFKNTKTNKDVQEVNFIFYPFTYFVIDKIKEGKGSLIDQVWISEIASPITLQKDIILWVDDIPNNNSIAIRKILNTKQVQILQLLSTIQAQKWLLEFGWLMNWKNINFKLISDNGRLQYKQQGDQPIQDYEAGLNLMHRIYIKRQLTVKSYIFCGDKQKVENTLRTNPKYQQLANKYNDKFKVTTDGNEIISFACSDQW